MFRGDVRRGLHWENEVEEGILKVFGRDERLEADVFGIGKTFGKRNVMMIFVCL